MKKRTIMIARALVASTLSFALLACAPADNGEANAEAVPASTEETVVAAVPEQNASVEPQPVANETVEEVIEEAPLVTEQNADDQPAVAPEVQVAVAAASGNASVSGAVKFEGDAPPRRTIDTAADPKCKAMHADDPLLSDAVVIGEDNAIQNVVVYIDNPPEGNYATPSAPAVLDQEGCQYKPHILTAHTGQTIQIANSDPLLHNVRSFARKNRPFNMGQPEGSNHREQVYDKVELGVKIKCDIHPWMEAYLFVFDHPFHAVTDAAGKFSISGLPAGTYTVIAWHERLGEQEHEVTVTDGSVTALDLSFAPPQS